MLVVAAEEPRLRATAAGAIERPFVVDETGLRKLSEIVRKRMAEQTKNSQFQYTVTFSDLSYYDTPDPEIMYKEENPDARRIVTIAILAKGVVPVRGGSGQQQPDTSDGDSLQIAVTLGPDKLIYAVRGPNRDWVFNTKSDIVERFSIITTGTRFFKRGLIVAGI